MFLSDNSEDGRNFYKVRLLLISTYDRRVENGRKGGDERGVSWKRKQFENPDPSFYFFKGDRNKNKKIYPCTTLSSCLLVFPQLQDEVN